MRRIFIISFLLGLFLSSCRPEQTITFGIITDVHQDIMHDAEGRLARFIDETNVMGTDFIIQLGDFCRPYDYNLNFLSLFNNHEGPAYHVIGNHEMDGGFSKDSVMKFFGMENEYYSFDQNGYHFIVLDGNDKNPSPDAASGYSRFIGDEQMIWLKNDLEATDNLCIVFSHQPLRGAFGVENSSEVRRLLDSVNDDAGYQKILASFNGHSHGDSVFTINDIYYIEINSASYEWLGGDYLHESYPKEIHDEYPWISYTAPYDQPLWAIVKISNNGTITIQGKQGNWKGPSPEELGHPGRTDSLQFSSSIKNRILKFATH
jgi:hypothetical protein